MKEDPSIRIEGHFPKSAGKDQGGKHYVHDTRVLMVPGTSFIRTVKKFDDVTDLQDVTPTRWMSGRKWSDRRVVGYSSIKSPEEIFYVSLEDAEELERQKKLYDKHDHPFITTFRHLKQKDVDTLKKRPRKSTIKRLRDLSAKKMYLRNFDPYAYKF
jgi:hypothetical protein